MRILMTGSIRIAALLLVAGALGACGNISHKVAADGSSAAQLMWPAPDSVTPMHKGGTFPNVADLRAIKSGMNKPQIMQLIGPPHFSEGIVGVREWNYLFNFRSPRTNDVTQCEYKILFDEKKLARSFYWQPESCASMLDEPAVTMVKPVADEQKFTLSSDALFAFNKSDKSSITAGGRAQMTALARKIKNRGEAVTRVRVVGYTDRLGSDAYNQSLSENRANTVMQVLKENGVSTNVLEARGLGESDPVKSCNEKARASLIACLAPNRRVEVMVEGRKGA